MLQTITIEEYTIPPKECLVCKKYAGWYTLSNNDTFDPDNCYRNSVLHSIIKLNKTKCHQPKPHILVLNIEPSDDYYINDGEQQPTIVSRITEKETWSEYLHKLYSRTMSRNTECVECEKKSNIGVERKTTSLEVNI